MKLFLYISLKWNIYYFFTLATELSSLNTPSKKVIIIDNNYIIIIIVILDLIHSNLTPLYTLLKQLT